MLEGATVTGESMRNVGLMVAALMAASGALGYGDPRSMREREIDNWGLPKHEPEDRGRRAEKDSEAMRKAEAKRARKAAKRLKNTPPNVRVEHRSPQGGADRPSGACRGCVCSNAC